MASASPTRHPVPMVSSGAPKTTNPERVTRQRWPILAPLFVRVPSAALGVADADLTDASLADANLGNANLSGATLSNATLAGVSFGRIIGTPSSFPSNWTLAAGYLIGPGANLFGADLADVDLTDADLSGAFLSNANLTYSAYALSISPDGAYVATATDDSSVNTVDLISTSSNTITSTFQNGGYLIAWLAFQP